MSPVQGPTFTLSWADSDPHRKPARREEDEGEDARYPLPSEAEGRKGGTGRKGPGAPEAWS